MPHRLLNSCSTGLLTSANVRLDGPLNDLVGIRFQQITERLQAQGVERNLPHVVEMVGEAGREIDMATRDHPHDAGERAVVVGRIERDVLVLADGAFRQPEGGRVDGLPSDKAD